MSALHQRSHSVPVSFGDGTRNVAQPLTNQLLSSFVDRPTSQRISVARSRRSYFPASHEGEHIFGATQIIHPIYEGGLDPSTATELRPRIHCKMERGFFFTDRKWTCYRRNYFQLSSSFTLSPPPSTSTFYVNGQPVSHFYMKLCAHTSDPQQKPVELIQLTPKRDKGPQSTPKLMELQPGGQVESCLPESNRHQAATFERIQFKTATANNGKKRASQQYYCLRIELIAQTMQDQFVVAYCTSLPVVVRGRSPGHYADNRVLTSPLDAEESASMTPTASTPVSLDSTATTPVMVTPYYPSMEHYAGTFAAYSYGAPHTRSQSVNDTVPPHDPRFAGGWDMAVHALSIPPWSPSRHRADTTATLGSCLSVDSTTPPESYAFSSVYPSSSAQHLSHLSRPPTQWHYVSHDNKRTLTSGSAAMESPPDEEQPASVHTTNQNHHAVTY